jgi:hypothetical protein
MNDKETKIDIATGRFLESFSQGISRRGVIARLGQFALSMLGLSLIPTLPLDRTFVADAQTVGCTDWRVCGLCGNLCTDCCGGSGSLTGCPSCTRRGHYGWTMCCPGPDCQGRMIEYWDCCGTYGTWTDAQAAACTGTSCDRNCPQDIWCLDPDTLAPLGTYRCTVVVVHTEFCSP